MAEDLCKFSKVDWTMIGSYSLLMFRDWKQTNEMVNRRKEGYYEKDNERILGKYPSHEKINIYYLTALSSSIALACWLDDPWRKIFLGGGIALEYSVTEHNQRVGLRSSINF